MKQVFRVSVRLTRWCSEGQARSYLFSRMRWFVFILITSMGCQPKLTEDEYVRWVTDYENRLHVRESVLGLIFDIQYQPDELIWIQRKRDVLANAGTVAHGGAESMQYYTLQISSENGVDIVHVNARDIVQKQERQYYLSYRFQNDITLEENGTVLPCVLFHAEGPRGRDGARTFLLGFEKPSEISEGARVVIRSDVFGSLPIKIRVAKANIPIIQL